MWACSVNPDGDAKTRESSRMRINVVIFVSAFVDGFGVDGDAVDLGEVLLDAILDGGSDVVDVGDGEAAVHGAVAGDEDFVLDEADVDIVAIGKLVIFGAEAVDEVANADGEVLHFLAAGDVRAERLDVNVDVRAGGFVEQILLERGGEAMGFAKAGMLVDFEMTLDEQATADLVRGKFVDGEAAALGRGANGFEEIFAGTRARLHVDDHVGGNDFADAALDAVACGVGFLEAGGARDADIHVDEIALAGAAQANAVD